MNSLQFPNSLVDFRTARHAPGPRRRAPRGLDRVAAWRRLVPADTPLVAIGGVALETAPAVVAAGADAVAVISALGGEEGEALRARVRRWRGVWGKS